MKSLASALAFLLSGFILTAQPVLTQADIAMQIGDIQILDSMSYVDMSTQEGPNMVWNLNDLTPQGTIYTAENVDPSETENADLFPESTVARTFDFVDGDIKQYFDNDGSAMQFWGTSITAGASNFSDVNSNPEFMYPTPMSYNAQGSDTYASDLIGGPVSSSSSGEMTWTTPGYGTLMINQETYNNVIMYRFHRLDTLETYIGDFTFYSYSDDVVYSFFAAGYHFPVVIFTQNETHDDFNPSATEYFGSLLLQQNGVGINESAGPTRNLSVYPNPFNGQQITLSYDLTASQAVTLTLADVQGRTLYEERTYKNAGSIVERIQFPQVLSAGSYLLTITAEGHTRTEMLHVN